MRRSTPAIESRTGTRTCTCWMQARMLDGVVLLLRTQRNHMARSPPEVDARSECNRPTSQDTSYFQRVLLAIFVCLPGALQYWHRGRPAGNSHQVLPIRKGTRRSKACARNVASHARTSPARLLRLVRLRLLFLMPDQISSDAPLDLSPCVSQTKCTQAHPRPMTLYQPCRHPSPRSPSPAHSQVRHSYCMHIYCFVRLPASRWRRASIFSRGGFSSFARGVRGRHAYVF